MCGSGVMRISPLQILDRGGAGKAVAAVDVHRAGAADAFAAGAAEGQLGSASVLILISASSTIGPQSLEIDLKGVVARVFAAVGIVAIDGELLRPGSAFRFELAAFAVDLAVRGEGKVGHVRFASKMELNRR